MTDNKSHIISEMQEELFLKQGEGWFRVVSSSMSPLISVQDRILVKKVESHNIKPRDIILFKNSTVFVTHRVLKSIRENGKVMILQRGDAGGSAGLIDSESVLGKVIGVEKKVRVLSLHKGKGRLLNRYFGLRNYLSYRFNQNIRLFKQRLRDKPGFPFLRAIYRIFKKPLYLMNRAVIKLFI